jgi:ribose 5-phosphate isomerase B
MRLAIGGDHAGFPLKGPIIDVLRDWGHEVVDLGTHSTESVDFPDITRAVCAKVLDGDADRAILVCGTGVGACIAANKIDGIRAVMATTETIARYSREHNGANVLSLGASMLTVDEAKTIVTTWISTPMREPRYMRRLTKISALERRS